MRVWNDPEICAGWKGERDEVEAEAELKIVNGGVLNRGFIEDREESIAISER